MRQPYGRYPGNLQPYAQPGYPNHNCMPGAPVPSPKYCRPPTWTLGKTARVWWLIPAVVVTGVFLVFSTQCESNLKAEGDEPLVSSCFINGLSFAASAGIAIYVFLELTDKHQALINAFIPVSLGVTILILLFAAAFTLTYRLFQSFKGDVGSDLATQFFAFLYLSINTFATAGDGGITPVTTGSRMLVNLELLFFVYIILLGMALFSAR